MSHPYLARGSLRLFACAAFILASTAPAAARHRRRSHHAAPVPAPRAEPAPQAERPAEGACTEVLKNAMEKETSGQLQAAAELFRSCARPSCAPFVHDQCATHFKTLENDVPTVVVMVSDTTGASRTDVEVRVDGSVVASSIDGRPVAIDPGMHDFTFATGERVFASGKVMILQGQRNRFVTVIMDGAGGGHLANEREQEAVETHEAPGAVPHAPSHRPSASVASAGAEKEATGAAAEAAEPAASEKEESAGDSGPAAEPAKPSKHRLLPFLIGGVGLASIGAGALLTTWGRKDNDTLANCAPNCAPAAVSHIRRVYYEADAAIGVGIAALVAAYLVYAINHDSSSAEATHEQALRLGIEPGRAGGGVASVSGRF